MNPVTISLTFCMLWWMVFFMLLPVGIKRDENPQPGNSPAAPQNPRLKPKIIATTIITGVVTFAFFFAQHQGWLDFMSPRG